MPIVALCAITLANLAMPAGKGEGELTVPVRVRVGDSLPELRLREVPCQVMVAVRSSCPFCGAAADWERTEGPALPTTWVAPSDDLGASEYRLRIHPTSRLVVSDSIYYGLMGTEAVPAGIAVNSTGKIVAGGRYPSAVKEACSE